MTGYSPVRSFAEVAQECGALRRENAELLQTMEQILDRMRKLVRNAGEPRKCRGCGVEIFFVRHVNGKHAPYDADGISHFVTCPEAKQFKRRREE